MADSPGDAYTFSEYDKMFRASGFTHNELRHVPMSPGAVIVSTRD